MATVQLAGNGIGGTVQGAYGTYTAAADGTYTVDTRDAPAMLVLGMSYLRKGGVGYTLPAAPRAASAGRIVASASLANGNLAIANQPDVGRQLNVIMGNGSPAITAGTVSVTYMSTDNVSHTDTFQANLTPLNGSITLPLSHPAVSISTPVVANMAGGGTPYVRMDDTNFLGLPADPGATDFVINAEYDTGSLQSAPGTPSTTCIGATSVVTTPNGTVTYSFNYGFIAPTV